jgi:hypothetical protein
VADEFGDLVSRRKRIADELIDPATRDRLMGYTRAEVGSQGPEAQQGFIESVINRALARGQRLPQTLSGSYFPGVTHRRAMQPMTDAERAAMQPHIDKVLAGSNITNYATGNASGTVGFAGGPQTYSAGGERYGVEGPDKNWWSRQGLPPQGPIAPQPSYAAASGVPGNTGLTPQPRGIGDLESLLKREALKKAVPEDLFQFSNPARSA